MSQTKAFDTARLHQDKPCPACPFSGFSSNLRYQTSWPLCYLPSPCNCSCLVAWRLGLVFFLARSIFTEAFFEEKGRTPGLTQSPDVRPRSIIRAFVRSTTLGETHGHNLGDRRQSQRHRQYDLITNQPIATNPNRPTDRSAPPLPTYIAAYFKLHSLKQKWVFNSTKRSLPPTYIALSVTLSQVDLPTNNQPTNEPANQPATTNRPELPQYMTIFSMLSQVDLRTNDAATTIRPPPLISNSLHHHL